MRKEDKVALFCFGLLILILGYFLFLSKPKTEEEELPIKLEQPEFLLENRPNRELVLKACEYYDIHNAHIVVAQSILETGHYRSENCRVHNNLFGLYNSNKKEYFSFDHWSESVKAYRDMIQYRYKDGENYYQFLNRIGYASDSAYNYKVQRIVKRYDSK